MLATKLEPTSLAANLTPDGKVQFRNADLWRRELVHSPVGSFTGRLAVRPTWRPPMVACQTVCPARVQSGSHPPPPRYAQSAPQLQAYRKTSAERHKPSYPSYATNTFHWTKRCGSLWTASQSFSASMPGWAPCSATNTTLNQTPFSPHNLISPSSHALPRPTSSKSKRTNATRSMSSWTTWPKIPRHPHGPPHPLAIPDTLVSPRPAYQPPSKPVSPLS
jgi:hypothetical protein